MANVELILAEPKVILLFKEVMSGKLEITDLSVLELKKNGMVITKKPVGRLILRRELIALLEAQKEYLGLLKTQDAMHPNMLLKGFAIEKMLKELIQDLYNHWISGNELMVKCFNRMVKVMCIFKLRRQQVFSLSTAIALLAKYEKLLTFLLIGKQQRKKYISYITGKPAGKKIRRKATRKRAANQTTLAAHAAA